MKQIHSMTEEEYNSLKASGMFWEIFPEATGDYIADATQSAINHIGSTVEQEMKDAGYTDEDLKQAKEFGEKFEALRQSEPSVTRGIITQTPRQTQPCCGQGNSCAGFTTPEYGDCDVDFDEDDSCNYTPTPTTVMYDATSLRMAVEWIYEHNHHASRQYSSVDVYEKAVMSRVGKFVKKFITDDASWTSTGGLTILGSWLDTYLMEVTFLVDPTVCSKRYSHYVEMESGGLIDFIESFAED